MLDSDLELDSVLLTDAARRATDLGNLTLAVQVARAAVVAGADSSHGYCWATHCAGRAGGPRPTSSWAPWPAPTLSEPKRRYSR
jgi:hypothetical protein